MLKQLLEQPVDASDRPLRLPEKRERQVRQVELELGQVLLQLGLRQVVNLLKQRLGVLSRAPLLYYVAARPNVHRVVRAGRLGPSGLAAGLV